MSNSATQTAIPWHSQSPAQAASQLQVDPEQGLTAQEARKRFQTNGPNAIATKERRGLWRIVLQQFSDFMIIVLIAAAVVSGVIGEPHDAIAIVVIILLNAVIGFVQDYRAEKAMEALKKLAAPSAIARRDGAVITLPTGVHHVYPDKLPEKFLHIANNSR